MDKIRKYRALIDKVAADNPAVQLYLHIEDAWFINSGNIEKLLSYRPYSVGLTWNYDNDLAGGALGAGRLTPMGAHVVDIFCEKGVRVDLAHLNRQSFFDVIAKVCAKGQKPLCTHTCFDEVNPHARNLTGEQIRAIIDADGTIGLTLVDKFLSDKCASITDVWRHVEYFRQNFGDRGLGIGTDFYGARTPRGLKNYRHLIQNGFDFHTNI
jgi:membrane dipeptidase